MLRALTPTFCRSASSDGTEARVFDPPKCRSNSAAFRSSDSTRGTDYEYNLPCKWQMSEKLLEEQKQAQLSLARLPRHGMIKYRGTLPNNSPSSLFRLFREAATVPLPPPSLPIPAFPVPAPHTSVPTLGPLDRDGLDLEQQGSRENRPPVAGGSISNHRLTGGFPVPAHNVSLGCQVGGFWVWGSFF
ncbi:predicted protein [Chaetomium globosum CBS 148.51]|uniref:Uncharacterized protein n=1 Tax=Chaetomium globosum (strain ATCC 6205 / CBS 148.51 / DSM 1962 / NBRC 6347 / NRRL 1970) TaxID=306901 RepID=Q2H7H3_CHAGB|nr:uncharacterized protein CHGG_05392 [Chaetomium globosum CBS 148.51]EAQ88773.1 predicted protein [Chaetomium globosum CBS 148.51]